MRVTSQRIVGGNRHIKAVSVETLSTEAVSVETLSTEVVSVETLSTETVSVETSIIQVQPRVRAGLGLGNDGREFSSNPTAHRNK